MRTTITIDDDIAARLKELQQRTRGTFADTVNRVLAQGLRAQESVDDPDFRVEAFSGGIAAGIDPAKLNQLLDTWDAEEFVDDGRPHRRSRNRERC